MTDVRSSATSNTSLSREALYAARYYLGNRWGLIALIVLVAALGLYFGGWGWLVAAGLAPIILSTLPCLVMCGLGVCMMCRGQKQSTVSSDTADAAGGTTSSAALGITKMSAAPAVGASCCYAPVDQAPLPQIKQPQSVEGKGDSDA
jgi:hypothetical protein